MSKKPKVLIIAGQKGGGGKSTSSRLLASYAESLKAATKMFDGQRGGDLSRFESRAQVRDTTLTRDLIDILPNELPPLTLIDLSGGQTYATFEAFHECQFLKDVENGSVLLGVAHVLGNSESSMSETLKLPPLIGENENIKYWLVKNHISADGGFAEWERDPRYSAKLQALAPMTISLGHLRADAAEALQIRGGSFTDFLNDGLQSRVLRGFVRSWMSAAFAEYDRVGLRDWIASSIG
jgi:hypothetical protein